MATANELYAMVPESVTNEIWMLSTYYGSHIPEVREDLHEFPSNIKTEKLEIKVLKDFDFDGRRFWRLATVWYEEKPVMIIQNAGREGDDHIRRYITDLERFEALCYYLRTFIKQDNPAIKDVIPPDQDLPSLTSFYGNTLEGHFERYRY
jgi:hypothetical protein